MKALVARGYGWMQAHPAAISFALLALVAAVGLRGEETRTEGQATRRIVERVVVEVDRHHKHHPTGVSEGGGHFQPPSHGGQQPGPPGGGHQGGGGHSGQEKPLVERPPASESSNAPPAPAVVEHVEEVVEQTPAAPVLETVNGTACHLLASC